MLAKDSAVVALAAVLASVSQNPERELRKQAAKVQPRAPQQHRGGLDRVYEADLQQESPDRAAAYQVMKDMWREVGGYFPNAKRMPDVEFWPSMYNRDAAAETTQEGVVRWPEWASKRLARGRHPDNDYVESALVHEWAHAHQAPGVFADPALREGAAEAFAAALMPVLARRAGRRFSDRTERTYPRERDAAYKRGLDFILRGQFG